MPRLAFQVHEDISALLIYPQEARSEAKALVLKPEKQFVNEHRVAC